jgi:hypothetical protein
MKFRDFVNEMGLTSYPKGWTRASAIKYAKTLTKSLGKGPKDEGFFDA